MRILSDDPGRSGARAASGIIDDVTSAKYSLIASLALAAMSAHVPLLEVVLSLLRAASGVIALPDVNHAVPTVLLNVSFVKSDVPCGGANCRHNGPRSTIKSASLHALRAGYSRLYRSMISR